MLNQTWNTSLYRTNDSVDNFRLKVVVRETSKPFGPDGHRENKVYEEEITLSWQEKKYGPSDIANFLANKDAKAAKDGRDADTFRHMQMLEERGKPLVNLLQPVMLYTYTDKNPGDQNIRAPVRFSTDDNIEPYLGVSVLHNNARDDVGERERKAGDRVFREHPFKVMHICLATDVDVEALKEKPLFPETHYKENILCSIRIFNDGLLEFTPELSSNLDEIGGRHAMSIAPSVFTNDSTVAAALSPTKGMRLSSYKVHSLNGREFEYALVNVHDLTSPTELDMKRRADLVKDSIAARATRSIDPVEADASTWKQDPPSRGYDKSISLYAEIVSGKNFQGDKLFVDYEVSLPYGWNLRTGNLIDGIGEQDLVNKAMGGDGIIDDANEAEHAMAARNLLDLDGYADGEDARGMLRGVTQIAAVKDIASGLSLPVLRPNWKGNRRNYVLNEFSRQLWGFGYFLFNVICILLGVNYPLWIVSSLILVITLVTGTGGGPSQVIISRNKDKTEKINGSMKYPRNRILKGNLVSEPSANFNHLINLSFDFKDNDITKGSVDVPTVIFSVYSVGSFGQINLEGYTYYHLPTNCCQEDTEIQTWKPLGGINAQMRDYFLGASPHLSDVNTFMNHKINNKKPHALNHFGMRSENSGSIRFRVQAAVTDPRLMITNNNNKNDIPKNDQKLEGARRTVNEILKNYRAGSDLTKSMELAANTMGMTMTKTSKSVSGSDLSRRAEALIAQAKARVSASGGFNTTTTTNISESISSSIGNFRSTSPERDDSPLMGTRTRVEPLQMDRVPGASRRVRRYAGEGEEEEDSLLYNENR
jgi:hypothetical protein